jgi:regulator of protease activity HflC (stomatin/prohibitin superfamily)
MIPAKEAIMIREKVREVSSGYLMIAVLVLAQGAAVYWMISAFNAQSIAGAIGSILTNIFVAILWAGLFMVNPNEAKVLQLEAKVLQLFGKYVGTVREPGLRWANPLYWKTKISTRVRNFETGKLKVNDSRGSPIEIAAVVVWKVYDSAEATFEVDDYEEFVHIQSESALRNLSTTYPYEPHEGEAVALRSHPVDIANALCKEIQERLEEAGVSVIEARISHLAYAPEIAHAMLRRQQASAIIAARNQIVSGAVGMVQMALDKLSQENIVDLDEERKAAMISNLLVVLCSEDSTQPVVNTGSLYT